MRQEQTLKGEDCIKHYTSHHIFSPCPPPSVIPRVTRHLLSNPVFSCITLAACMEIAVVAGFAAFLGKYLEQQFNLTTSSANQLLGRRRDLSPGKEAPKPNKNPISHTKIKVPLFQDGRPFQPSNTILWRLYFKGRFTERSRCLLASGVSLWSDTF